MTRALIYCRVSSASQELDGTSLSTQEERCRAYCNRQGHQVIGVFRDTHSGGQYRERPGLSALRERVRAGVVDVVVCYAVDRLSRNQAHLYILAEEIEEHRGRLEFVTEDFEDSAVGRFLRSAKAFAAEVEREKITERTTRGRRARIDAGRPIPGYKPLYGYLWADSEHSRLITDPETAPVVRRIYDDYLAGATLRQVVAGLFRDGIPSPRGRPEWSLTTVGRLLHNPNYTGTAYGWWRRPPTRTQPFDTTTAIRLPDGIYPPIVSHEEWQAVQTRLRLNKAFAARNNPRPEQALLRGGIARCGYCGKVMVATAAVPGRNRPRYHCTYRPIDPSEHHRNVGISIDVLDTAVWERVTRLILNPAVIAGQLVSASEQESQNGHVDHFARIDRQLAGIAEQEANVASAIAVTGDIMPLVEQLKRLQERRVMLEAERLEFEALERQHNVSKAQFATFRAWCNEVAGNLDRLAYRDKRDVLELLGVSVRVFMRDDPDRYLITASIPLDDEGCVRRL